jgi:hypothetical protein
MIPLTNMNKEDFKIGAGIFVWTLVVLLFILLAIFTDGGSGKRECFDRDDCFELFRDEERDYSDSIWP